MDDRLPTPRGAGTDLVPHGNLLGPVIRRDIADLNRLFLDLTLEPALEEDPRFSFTDSIRAALRGCPGAVRSRLADSPFCLFHLRLPANGAAGIPGIDRVADARQPPPPDPVTASRCLSFVLLSLSVARHLAGNSSLSPRIALGVSQEARARLSGMGPAELGLLAAWPGLLRPRWPRHERFWAMMIGACRASDASIERWAHCAGLCLLAAGEGDAAPVDPPPARRRVRLARVRSGPGVPC